MRPGLSRLGELTYAAMRIVAALIYFCHGLQKVFGAFGGHVMPLTSLMGVAGLIETILGPLIAIGLLTPWAAFIGSGEMAAAYFKAHAPRGPLPIENGGELAVILCFVFLYIATQGGGRYSVDGRGR